MEYIKLGDLFKITSGGTPSKKNNEFYDDGSIPWIKTGDLKVKYINSSSEYITELAVEKSSAKLFPRGTVLIAMYGATIGATSILNIEATTNQACCAFLPNNKIKAEYLYYFFIANKEKIVSMGVGGAQPNISATILKEIKIPLSSLEKQISIVNLLDKAQELINKRKEQIEALDELVKSKFIEMFGDPILNKKGWEVKRLVEVCEMKAGKNIKAADIYPENIGELYPCYGGNGLRGYVKEYSHDGNIPLIGRQGALCGNVKYAQGKFYATEHAVVTQPKIEMNSYWLYFILEQLDLNRLSTGAAQPGLTVGKLNEVELPISPIELQNKFEEFALQVDKLKFEMEKSLKELEDNFNSLMQKAFKGELFD